MQPVTRTAQKRVNRLSSNGKNYQKTTTPQNRGFQGDVWEKPDMSNIIPNQTASNSCIHHMKNA